MSAEIEEMINENIYLKKVYKLSKLHESKLEQQVNELQENLQELKDNYLKINEKNQQLYKKNRKLQSQSDNNNISFIAQIEQLKSLIQQKQRDLQNLQLKIIPSLDQDMMRVKLIAEMEGPYQQAMDKKNHEIAKLKQQIYQIKREKQILEFSVENKTKQYKRQVEDIKQFYQNQIERLNKQLAHFGHKNSGKTLDREMIQSYKAEIDQLRVACQFHKNTEEELRRELVALRMERQKLLNEFSKMQTQKAIQLRNSQLEIEWRALKSQKSNLEDELKLIREQLERLRTKNKLLQTQKRKYDENYSSELKDTEYLHEKQLTNLKKQLAELQQQMRKLKDIKNKVEQQNIEIYQKYKRIVNNQDSLEKQNENLKKEKIQKDIREKIQRQIVIERREVDSPKREKDQIPNQGQKIKKLEEKIRKLEKKLQFANRKILQLLHDKAKSFQLMASEGYRSLSPEHDYLRMLLQHRDCSLVPVCPPVIMEPIKHFAPF